MIRSALVLALLVPLGYHPQYLPAGPHFPTVTPLNPCLISAWPMNEGSGLTLNDTSTGGTNTATISGAGAVTWTANAIKTGVTSPVWTGTGSAVSTSTTLTNFTGTTPFSVSFWAKATGPGSYLGTLNTAGATNGWEVKQNTNTEFEFFIINTFPGNRLDVTIGVTTNTGLHFFVVTYDGSQNVSGVKIYVDGTSIAVGTVANTLSATAANGLPITFAARNNGATNITGAMGYAEVYNCVVTSGFVSSSFAAGPGIY